MNEDRLVSVIRTMAWERAKGELRSMLQTFYDNRSQYEALKKEIENFTDKVESDGVHE